ncbi:hypothetical protein BC830DRAFT_1175452 [Chytriomyces sp. MP71]|nr:hypothetical protein BC830DRAFT_1175452 [Chytriomyces sp. MP71]
MHSFSTPSLRKDMSPPRRAAAAREFAAGIAILKQLGHHADAVRAFLAAGQVLHALELAQEQDLLRQFAPGEFLELAYASRNRTLFLTVYKLFEERGLLSIGDAEDFPHSDEGVGGTAKYFSIYREFWEESLMMEAV